MSSAFSIDFLEPTSKFQKLVTFLLVTLENHCTPTGQSLCGGCSQQVHKIEYLVKGNILVNVLLLKIFIANYYHLKIQLCIFLTNFLWVE